MQLIVWSKLRQNAVSHGVCYINSISLFDCQLIANQEKNNDTVNTSIYLKKDDKLSFEKYGENASFNVNNRSYY